MPTKHVQRRRKYEQTEVWHIGKAEKGQNFAFVNCVKLNNERIMEEHTNHRNIIHKIYLTQILFFKEPLRDNQ